MVTEIAGGKVAWAYLHKKNIQQEGLKEDLLGY